MKLTILNTYEIVDRACLARKLTGRHETKKGFIDYLVPREPNAYLTAVWIYPALESLYVNVREKFLEMNSAAESDII